MLFSKKFVKATHEYADYNRYVPAPYMRRSIELSDIPEKAEITVTGLGFYRLFVNGKDITKGLLAPYISNPDQTVYFDNYDIKKYLTKGKNTLGFTLGNGFHNCIGGHIWDMAQDIKYRSAPKLAFALEAKTKNEDILIEADEKVLTHPSAILFDDLRCGVHYDARCEISGWNLPEFDDSSWTPAIPTEAARGEYVLCTAEPIKIYKELSPVSIKKNVYLDEYDPRKDVTEYETSLGKLVYDSSDDDNAPGYLYDFGENNAGVIRLKIKGEKGQRIVLQLVEHMTVDNQKCYLTNLHFYPAGFAQRDIYICRGGEEEIFIPDFTYHGFRYVWVTGINEEQAENELLTYLVASSSLETRGDFRCSDDMTNKLWEAGLRSDLSNFYYFPTDCPHREKNGWTGDASVSAEHMTLKLAPEKSYRAWLNSIRNAQASNGAIPGIVPTAGWGFKWGSGPVWDSVIFTIPYYTYIYRGDTDIIRENADMMLRYLSYIANKRDDAGLVHIGLGDWCPALANRADDYDAPLEFTDSAATMENARMAAVMLRSIGYDLQAEFAEALYDEMRSAIRDNLIDFSTMTVHGGCQSCQAIAIALNIFDDAEKSEAFTRLLEFIALRDDHFDVGFYGARYIFHVLSDFGEEELAFKMITREDFPSYGNWIARGATTLYENFFPEGQNGSSYNHHFWGDITAWFTKTILGIRINPFEDNPTYVQIKPKFLEELSFAEGYYDTVCGRLSVSWKREENTVLLDISVPEGICGKIILPFGYRINRKAYLELEGGSYRLERSDI